MKKLLALLLLVSSLAFGNTVTGVIQTATGGPVANGTLTLTPTQSFVVAGTATVVSSAVACYTDANGNVVGEPNPLVAPVVTPNTSSGTLAAATYFIRLVYQDASGTSFSSPETTTVLSSTGSLIVTAPVKQPATATGYQVFISTSTGTETLQGTITGTPGTWSNYTQSSALAAGSALPASNTTACKPFFNDQGSPVAAYNVTLTTASGSTVAGFPQRWQLLGGSAGSVNLSNGTPLWNGFVQYPQAIVTTPAFNATQSIAGNISLGGFSLAATNFLNSGFAKFTEIAAPVCSAGFDFIWADSTAHKLKQCNNGGSVGNFTQDSGLSTNQVPKENASGVLVPSSFADDGTNASTSEPFTAQKIGGIFQIGTGPGQFSTIQACLNAIPTATYANCTTVPNLAGGTCWTGGGGACVAPPGYTETLTADLTLTHDKKLIMYPPAVVNTNGFKVKCDMVLINSVACSGAGIESPVWNNHNEASSGVVFNGGSAQAGNLFDIGDGISSVGTMAFRNIQIHCIDCAVGANALSLNKVSDSKFENLDLVVSQNVANTGKCLVTTGGFGNRFDHLVPNFCNTAISQGDNADIFEGLAFGAPLTAAGSVYFSLSGANNVIRNPVSISTTYAKYVDLTGSASGNYMAFPHTGTTDVVFGASTVKNVFDCIGGGCTVTDSSALYTGNNVVSDPAAGIWKPVGTPYHNNNITSNPGAQTVLAAPVNGVYWWMSECHTKTAGSGTTGTFSVSFANDGGAQTVATGTFALNTTAFATGSVGLNFFTHIASGTAATITITGTWGTSVAECSSNLVRVQ